MGSLNSRWIFLVGLSGATTISIGCGSPVYEIPRVEEHRTSDAGGKTSTARSVPFLDRSSGGAPASVSANSDLDHVGGASGAMQSGAGSVTVAAALAGRSTQAYADFSAGRENSGSVSLGGVTSAGGLTGMAGCDSGSCQTTNCPASVGDCSDTSPTECESNNGAEVSECGVCGDTCNLPHSISTCANGHCAVLVCEAGWADCNQSVADGCEVNLASNASHCGDCDAPCVLLDAVGVCVNGECTEDPCSQGRGDCNQTAADGCEVDLQTDSANCGVCGVTCGANHGSARCNSGACKLLCDEGYADCDGDTANGCESETLSSAEHCGGCNKPCAGECKQGTCAATPCSGLCENPTVIIIGSGATVDIGLRACHESYQATKAFVSGNCGQLEKGRKLYVNGVAVNCDTLPWDFSPNGKPLPRHGGYCFHDDGLGSNGDFAWLNTW